MADRSVTIVDDDKSVRDALSTLFSRSGWDVHVLDRGAKLASHLLQNPVDVVVSDLRMPQMDGLEMLRGLPEGAPRVILISAHGDIAKAVEAMQAGAYTFLEKPYDPKRLLLAAEHAADQHRLTEQNAQLRSRVAELSGLDKQWIGPSRIAQSIRDQIVDFANLESPVLILGNTGTGKDLTAKALHDMSERAEGPFVQVDCANLPQELFTRLMFGEDNGREGYLSAAQSGTVFLNDVTALSLDQQSQILTTIERHCFTPVGGITEQKLDLRFVSAATPDIEDLVTQGAFRNDLMYRLNPVQIKLPDLSERKDDISILFAHFVGIFAKLYQIETPKLGVRDVSALVGYHWPGNIRELRNIAERFTLACKRGETDVASVLNPGAETEMPMRGLREAVAGFEREVISAALRAHQGRMDDVAADLRIGRRTLNEKIVKLGLNKKELL